MTNETSVHGATEPEARLVGDTATEESVYRRVERWGLVAGVTGCTANGLLLALYALALPGNHAYDWTGPANDVTGAVSLLATVPLTLGVNDLLGRSGALPALSRAVVVGNVATAATSALLITGLVDLRVQIAVAIPAVAVSMLWLRSAGRWAQRTLRLPKRLARSAEIIGTLGVAGMPLLAAGAVLPRGSVAQLALAGPGLATTTAAYLAYPVWQILLSRAAGHRPMPGRLPSAA